MVQCDLPLHIPPMAGHIGHTPTGYMQHALLHDLDASIIFLTHIQHLFDSLSLANTQLKPTLDGAYIIPHQKRSSLTSNTHYIISIDHPHSYAILATLKRPICTQLITLINIRITNHAQIIHLQINPHTHSIRGRTYHQVFLTPGAQELARISHSLHTTISKASLLDTKQANYIIGRPSYTTS